jgi:hypothetical protein
MSTTSSLTAATNSAASSKPATPTETQEPVPGPVNYVFPIQLIDATHARPQVPWDTRIRKGDTVEFTSADGVPRVVFEGVNPFSTEPGMIIPNGGKHQVVADIPQGEVGQAYCWIRRVNPQTKQEEYIGYGSKSDKNMSGYTVPPPKT